MYSIRVIGAGSIGNHLAHAARVRGWAVTLTDQDPAALERARTSIYPDRYGSWDDEIVLADSAATFAEPADVVFIGTPPDSHVPLALATLNAMTPRIVLIEKPLAGPDRAGCQDLLQAATAKGVTCLVGYNHCLGQNTRAAEEVLRSGACGEILTISTRTREHWQGIFQAHPWLPGPSASYLGFSARGGGATGEHSHAINMWQHFARVCGAGRVVEVSARLDRVREGSVDYDRSAFITLTTETGLVGDVIQDVVTHPAEKSARIQGSQGYVEWQVNAAPGLDRVVSATEGSDPQVVSIPKTRADDFIAEIDHLAHVLEGGTASPISLENGLETMAVIAAAFRSDELGRRVHLDWSNGPVAEISS